MKVSIVIAILNSHQVVKRQIRHFRLMKLPEDVEFIFVDDGSNPPLDFGHMGLRNLTFYYTNDKRPWTQGLARNFGASVAQGEYLFFTDIDHIITDEAIEAVREFDGDKMVFFRYLGILSKHGVVVQDLPTLFEFGLNLIRHKRHGLGGGYHGNTYAIRKVIFDEMGGYDPKHCQSMFHVGGKYMSEERNFNIRYQRGVKKGKYGADVTGPPIYVYPLGKFHKDGDHNPWGLFHGLSFEQVPQPMKE